MWISSVCNYALADNPNLIKYLDKANRKSYLATKWLVIFVNISCLGTITMAFINVAFCNLLYGVIDTEFLYSPYYVV